MFSNVYEIVKPGYFIIIITISMINYHIIDNEAVDRRLNDHGNKFVAYLNNNIIRRLRPTYLPNRYL